MRCSWGERRMNTWTCVDNHAGKPPEKGERRGIHSDIYFGVLSDIRCAFLSGIWSDIYLAFYLAFYLTFIPTCHLAFYLAFSVPVWLTYILAYSGVPFAIHSDIQHLTFFCDIRSQISCGILSGRGFGSGPRDLVSSVQLSGMSR